MIVDNTAVFIGIGNHHNDLPEKLGLLASHTLSYRMHFVVSFDWSGTPRMIFA